VNTGKFKVRGGNINEIESNGFGVIYFPCLKYISQYYQ